MDETGNSVDSSKLPEISDEQNDSLTCGESSSGIVSAAGQRSMLSQSIISLSFRSQSSTDSCDTIFSNNARCSEASPIDQPDNNIAATQSSKSNKHHQPHSGRSSSCHVSEVTQETMLLSPRQYPPLQVMDRSAHNDLDRTSSSVYTPNNTPQKWSAASTESLFSLHEGRISSILMSNRPSVAAGPETTTSDAKGKEQAEADPSISQNTLPDVTVQKIPNHIDTNVCVPATSSNPRRNNGKIQPLPTSADRKHGKPSSCCKSLSCCVCSFKSLSCTCCCQSLGSCCSRPKCSCCKMPSCSCSCCSLKWCCNWNCFSKKTCCSVFDCCSKWSCSCPNIRSCGTSCKSCSNAICCWNWSCWKLLCSWNCNCCAKTSCWRNWSCCSKGSCCKSWSCFSKGSCCCCKPWNCCSKGTCCFSWSCCCRGTCCSSWNCCSKGSCCKSWKC